MKNIINILKSIIFNPVRAIKLVMEKIYLKEAIFLLAFLVLWKIMKISLLLPASFKEEIKKRSIFFSHKFILVEFLINFIYIVIILIFSSLVIKYIVEFLFSTDKKVCLYSIFTFFCFAGIINIVVGLFEIAVSYITFDSLYFILLETIIAIWIVILIAIFIRKTYELPIWKIILIILTGWILNRVFIYPFIKAISVFMLR